MLVQDCFELCSDSSVTMFEKTCTEQIYHSSQPWGLWHRLPLRLSISSSVSFIALPCDFSSIIYFELLEWPVSKSFVAN